MHSNISHRVMFGFTASLMLWQDLTAVEATVVMVALFSAAWSSRDSIRRHATRARHGDCNGEENTGGLEILKLAVLTIAAARQEHQAAQGDAFGPSFRRCPTTIFACAYLVNSPAYASSGLMGPSSGHS